MTNTQSYSSSSYSYSSSGSNINGEVSGQRTVLSSHTDNNGTTVRSSNQRLGENAVEETRRFDTQGRELIGDTGADASRRIQDVTDEEQAQRDREYEERIEEEYAKREGGA